MRSTVSKNDLPSKATIHLVDDDPAIHRLVEATFADSSLPVRCFASPEEFLAVCTPDCRGCLILDIEFPSISGVELQRQVEKTGASLPVLFLSGTADVPMTTAVMKQGALDLIQKPFDPARLASAVKIAIEIDASRTVARQRRQAAQQAIDRLTLRERDVLKHLVAGSSNKEIAISLGLSDRTIEIHRARVMHKTNSDSLASLIRLAFLAGSDAPLH